MRSTKSQTKDSLEFVKEVVQYEYFPNVRKFRGKDEERTRRRGRRKFPSLFPIRRRKRIVLPPLDPIMEHDDRTESTIDTTEQQQQQQQSMQEEKTTTEIQAVQSFSKGYYRAMDVLSLALLLVLPAALLTILNERYHRTQQVIIRRRSQGRKQKRRVPDATPMLRRRFSKVAAAGPVPPRNMEQNTKQCGRN
jgi:hypothetical protein